MNINGLLRENIKKMKAYSSARSEFDGQATVFLDANENAFGSAAGKDFNRYPDPLQMDLKQRIAVLKNIKANNIFLGNGSDEPIDLLIRAFCEPGRDHIITLPPTYGMYQVAADLNNVAIKQVTLLEDFQIDVAAVSDHINEYTKLIFICSPNNPTGNLVSRESILQLLRSFRGLIVLDEAYIDFAAAGNSMIELLDQFPNLVILQTFSKAWGMAALRLGMAFASGDIVDVLNKIKPPYNINLATQQQVLEALKQEPQVKSWVKETLSQREKLQYDLTTIDCVEKLCPTDANFILARVSDADNIYKFLLQKGIVVRNRSGQPGCDNCLRITIGTEYENNLLVQALKEYDQMQKQAIQ